MATAPVRVFGWLACGRMMVRLVRRWRVDMIVHVTMDANVRLIVDVVENMTLGVVVNITGDVHVHPSVRAT